MFPTSHIIQVLHPCHKLKYFKNAGWDEDWIATAREIVQAEFDRAYAFMDIDEPDDLPSQQVIYAHYPCLLKLMRN